MIQPITYENWRDIRLPISDKRKYVRTIFFSFLPCVIKKISVSNLKKLRGDDSKQSFYKTKQNNDFSDINE